jgi:hypothetical protein
MITRDGCRRADSAGLSLDGSQKAKDIVRLPITATMARTRVSIVDARHFEMTVGLDRDRVLCSVGRLLPDASLARQQQSGVDAR